MMNTADAMPLRTSGSVMRRATTKRTRAADTRRRIEIVVNLLHAR